MIVKDFTNFDIHKQTRKKSVALIPVGSIEQHGPHLPVSTDSDIVSYIAKKISDKMGFLLLPTIEYGVSFEHSPFFNLSITATTLQKILVDLCVSLYKNKIATIIILNGHHGNHTALKQIPKRVSKIHGINTRILVYSYWHFMKRQFDHAGFVETSIMLAISKRVQMNKAKKGLVPNGLSDRELARLSRLAKKSFPYVTKNGVWGDPRNATAKDGRRILDEIVTAIVKESQTCLTGKSRKLHQ
ncbi:MAG: creatininase family protein [Thaumarchaeota archaeon]|nr:MAG: creatininase family protein [Nitrososphaerota archaeon]